MAFHTKKEKILKTWENEKKYLIVRLSKNGKRKDFRVHRLVAHMFISNPEKKPYIDHIDTNRQNNHVDNLKWCTHKENCNNPLTRKNLRKDKK